MSSQPATDYYAWQVEVYLTNFGSGKRIQVIGSINEFIPDSWKRLIDRFKDVEFYFYEDTRGENKYPPSLQSHILAKHFKSNEYLKDYAIFYHDSDFVFTRDFDFTPFLHGENWYFSDTISYIGADYIVSKGEEVLDWMCRAIDISPELVKQNQLKSGGAQKLIKNVDHTYWEQVFDNTMKLYQVLTHFGRTTDIQVWTASMWAELWTAWKMGYNIEVPKEFDFCWATCYIDRWNDCAFFHNAGVMNGNQGMFCKSEYINKYPYDTNLFIDNNRCSYNYYKLIKSIDSCLI